jgi:peptidoglycan/LPS O-acetylase OafA/YrhL
MEGGFDHLDKMKTTSSTSAPTNELLLDSTVKSFFGDASSTLTRWRSNHFTLYLFTVSVLTGLGVGFMAALLAHYGCDPRATWRTVRKKSTWLAAACGLGTAVLLVGVMLPIPPQGRFTYLVLSAATCAASAALGCLLCFVVVRRIRQGRAVKSGLLFNLERMKGF